MHVQENGFDERAPWISMEDTVFSDEDSVITTVSVSASRSVIVIPDKVAGWILNL